MGVRIEIEKYVNVLGERRVAPLVGVRIEILLVRRPINLRIGRSPRGSAD